MPTRTLAGTTVDVNEEGFFTEPTEWNEEIAVELAKEAGIDELTPDHWKVLEFMRSQYFEKGTGPTVRVLGKTSASRSRSSTCCSRRARRRWPPRSPASPSPAAASDPPRC